MKTKTYVAEFKTAPRGSAGPQFLGFYAESAELARDHAAYIAKNLGWTLVKVVGSPINAERAGEFLPSKQEVVS
jgi:hypothetical protein